MPIREGKGKWARSSSLRDSKAKKHHPLNFKLRSVASHHVVSCDTLSRLSEARQQQDVNHQKNLVILPTVDEISCQYSVPLHKSGHTDSDLIAHYEERTGEEVEVELASLAPAPASRESIQEDVVSLNAALGYHKVVAKKLAFRLKSINCDTLPKNYIETIDDVSIEIISDIASFDLLLISRGKLMEEGDKGCARCIKKSVRHTHYTKRFRSLFKLKKRVPEQVTVDSFSYIPGKYRLMSVREQSKIITKQ
ncbi:AHH domain-containing protein [uncultured Vibrio sp.]|uniref:AHH domain-containing protein n=1 Tax=uncultured Vibrio sp. TaxID=114054 RepID=UPI00260D6B2A|nr:AHH domain-containing protein [uncultured Vibrio sp.]